MTPLGWGWAAFVWGYALLWFLVNDRIKLRAYRIFDPVKSVAKPESKTENRKVQTETTPESKSTADTKAKTPADLTPQTAKRAYELYEREGHRDGHSVQDWETAEREVRKDETKVEANGHGKNTP